jgi:hypothetical protein
VNGDNLVSFGSQIVINFDKVAWWGHGGFDILLAPKHLVIHSVNLDINAIAICLATNLYAQWHYGDREFAGYVEGDITATIGYYFDHG